MEYWNQSYHVDTYAEPGTRFGAVLQGWNTGWRRQRCIQTDVSDIHAQPQAGFGGRVSSRDQTRA